MVLTLKSFCNSITNPVNFVFDGEYLFFFSHLQRRLGQIDLNFGFEFTFRVNANIFFIFFFFIFFIFFFGLPKIQLFVTVP